MKPMVLASLGLPEDPQAHLAERAALLHDTFTEVIDRLSGNAAVSFDDNGRLHLAAVAAEADPPSLVELRTLTNRMLPRVDLPEVLLEVFSWTGADQAFTSITGGETRLADLGVSIAALLVVDACNITRRPVIKSNVEALTRDRLAHVEANYLRLDTHPGGQRQPDPGTSRHRPDPAVGRRPRRLRRRDAVRRPGAHHPLRTQPPILPARARIEGRNGSGVLSPLTRRSFSGELRAVDVDAAGLASQSPLGYGSMIRSGTNRSCNRLP